MAVSKQEIIEKSLKYDDDIISYFDSKLNEKYSIEEYLEHQKITIRIYPQRFTRMIDRIKSIYEPLGWIVEYEEPITGLNNDVTFKSDIVFR